MIQRSEIYKKKESLIKQVENEFLLIPLNQDTVDLDTAFVLSETGAFIFEQIDGNNSVSDIIKLVYESFDVSKEKAREDVVDFFGQIKEQFLVQTQKPDHDQILNQNKKPDQS